ncbi:hypothetical protein CBER1_10794 [Cercospora berteroae]|uniref:Heme haloperoxidase family profile domain-containing protein n=1 Tax=Cercospora berteroae TaxID=357750 RepID=A0A2S6BZ12_9PEZI|nr:hypothetical protein CBER1_10794 [Cercospora berteroae]
MKFATAFTISQAPLALGHFVRLSQWKPAGPNDLRGPCPMMNTLANHGLLPHDGRNLTREVFHAALSEGLNFESNLTDIMFDQALPANPQPNATWFDLGQLNVHNVLEHDASLSRKDAYFGNNHIFDQDVFDFTKKFWTAPVIDRYMLANSKIARQVQSRSTNPTYKFTASAENFSIGELLAPVIAFGDRVNVTVDRDLVVYFFENERLPTELGWKRQSESVGLKDIIRLSGIFSNATTLLTE